MGMRVKQIEVEGIELRTIEQKNDFVKRLSKYGINNEDEAFELESYIEDCNAVIIPLGDLVAQMYGKNFYWVVAFEPSTNNYNVDNEITLFFGKSNYLNFIKDLGYSDTDVKLVKGERLG
jgi:hypothetical protein